MERGHFHWAVVGGKLAQDLAFELAADHRGRCVGADHRDRVLRGVDRKRVPEAQVFEKITEHRLVDELAAHHQVHAQRAADATDAGQQLEVARPVFEKFAELVDDDDQIRQ